MVKGQVSNVVEVGVPASEVWEIYGTLELGNLVGKLLPEVLDKVELVEGDGGVGTVMQLTPPAGAVGFSIFKEKYTKVDNENRIKETEVIEGGYLDLGFTSYRMILEITEKDSKSSFIKSSIDYEIDDDSAANSSLASTRGLDAIAVFVGKYLSEKKANAR